jgi:hypothetical protein
MTESQWLISANPRKMLAHPAGKGSDRKIRLFSAACTRRVWHMLEDDRSRKAVKVLERLAEGMASEAERKAAGEATWQTAALMFPNWPAEAVARGFVGWPWEAAERTILALMALAYGTEQTVRLREQAGLLRDVLGNPFRPVTINPAWFTPTVTSLATVAYEERALPSGELNPASPSLPTLWRKPVASTPTS